MKTAVVYARYSSTNQTEQSIEGQIHVCDDFAKRNNILIVDHYIDRAMSGTNDNRDAFQQMLKDSNNKKWDYVLVYKLDRFSRDKYESAIHRKHLKDNGTILLSAMENIPDTPEGIILESLLEGMNEYFSKELAQKVSRGQHESRMKGHCIGRVPYGYIKDNNKMLSINDDEAFILTKIFEEYSSGKTILQITRDLEKENITNKGRKFSQVSIRHILTREFYTGTYKLKDKVYDKIYPQIIPNELFDKVQTRLNANRYGCRKDNHQIFKLKDKIFCGNCNKKMYPISAISHNGKSLRYYNCITTKKRNCPTGKIYKDFIENIVDRFIIEQFTIQENLDTICNNLYELYKKNMSNNLTLNSLKSELQKTNTAITNIMSAIEKGIYTETTKSRLEELETKRNNLQEKVAIEEAKQQFEMTKEELQNYFTSALKQNTEQAIMTFIKCVKVYENKIEIELNNVVNTNYQNPNPTIQKLFTENFTTERLCKGGIIHTKTKPYDVYLVY